MAKTGRINFGGGGGLDPDELNATSEQVLDGFIFGGSGSDEPQTGTMPNNGATANKSLNCGGSFTVNRGYHASKFTVKANSLASQTGATATSAYIYTGKTAWVNGSLVTGALTVSSLLSFSVAAYSGKILLFKWQNPYAAAGKAFGGVIIRYSTSGYPGYGGTLLYQGAGSSGASGAISQVTISMPAVGTTYYFSCYPYVNTSLGTWQGGVLNDSCTTQGLLYYTVTGTQTLTVPEGYSMMDAFAVGGGASGGCTAGFSSSDNAYLGAGGGGGGYTASLLRLNVSPGNTIACSIGAGGGGPNRYGRGNPSSVALNGTTILTANGADYVAATYGTGSYRGGKGGSGGGGGGYNNSSGHVDPGPGGSNGGSGGGGWGSGGSGQGTTTRAFGESSGALYAGGGAGGGSSYGAAGGGAGGGGSSAADGTAGTGGGGGGRVAFGSSDYQVQGIGGSGVVLIRLY